MGVNEVKHEMKLRQWRQRIGECRSSGDNVRQWCRENHVHPSTYYRWERELFGEIRTGSSTALATTAERRLVEVPLGGSEMNAEGEIISSGPTAFKPVAVIRIGRMELSLTNGVSAKLMQQVKELMACAE